MGIKLIALDMDGTTLNSDVKLAAETRQAIEKAMDCGVYVVPCTGRVFSQIPREIMSIDGLNYAITANGARVLDLSDYNRVIYENVFEPQTMDQLLAVIDRDDIMVEAYLKGKSYIEKRVLDNLGDFGVPEAYFNFFKDSVYNDSGIPVASHEEMIDHLRTGGIEKLNIFMPTAEIRTALISEIKASCPVKVTSSMPSNIELNAATANKGDGLFHLCEELGLDRKQVMAMGDSNNDLDMLNFAGFAVAMGNAEERVKQISDFVTTTNDDLGVVKALKQFVLDEQVS